MYGTNYIILKQNSLFFKKNFFMDNIIILMNI